jgi:dihydrofolate synthase/folylpolyglutamate synthase
VVALGSDKDALGYLKVLAGRVDRLACTSKGVGPSHAPEDLRGVARRLGIEAEVLPAPEAAIERAMQLALERSTRGGWVLVTGSLHLVGAVRSRLVPARQGSSC